MTLRHLVAPALHVPESQSFFLEMKKPAHGTIRYAGLLRQSRTISPADREGNLLSVVSATLRSSAATPSKIIEVLLESCHFVARKACDVNWIQENWVRIERVDQGATDAELTR